MANSTLVIKVVFGVPLLSVAQVAHPTATRRGWGVWGTRRDPEESRGPVEAVFLSSNHINLHYWEMKAFGVLLFVLFCLLLSPQRRGNCKHEITKFPSTNILLRPTTSTGWRCFPIVAALLSLSPPIYFHMY